MAARPIRLSPEVALPLDAVTQTFAILGKRGSGKTNSASVLAEQLIEHGQPVVYVDPVGVTWGLELAAAKLVTAVGRDTVRASDKLFGA